VSSLSGFPGITRFTFWCLPHRNHIDPKGKAPLQICLLPLKIRCQWKMLKEETWSNASEKCQEEERMHQLYGRISGRERSNLQFFKFTARMRVLVQHFLRSDHVLAPAGKMQNSVNFITSMKDKQVTLLGGINMSVEKEFYLCQWQLKFWFCYCLIQENIPITKGKGQPTNMKHDGKRSCMKIEGSEFRKYCQILQIK